MLDEFVRGQLRNALSDLPMTQKGQIAIMSDTAAGDGYTDRPVRCIESEGSTVEVEAEPVRYHEGKKYKQNKPLILESGFQSSIWRQAVNRLSEEGIAWAKYCYGDSTRFEYQVVICHEVWSRFQALEPLAGLKKMSAKTRAKVQQLAWLAVQVSASQINGGERSYSAAELSRLIGIKPDNWQHNYLPRWSLLISACNDYDNEVIGYVGRQLKAERNRRRDCRVPV